MANLIETSTFEAGIYQLETSDPVLGGPGGISNLQPQQLANRTRFLKDQLDVLQAAAGGYATLAQLVAELNKRDHKQSVRAATTADIALNGLQTIDGVALQAGDRVLVKNQITGAQNGIYVANASAWVRATDADENAEVTSGMVMGVEEGALNGGTRWKLTTSGSITVGTTALVFVDILAGYAPLASPGLTGNPTAPTPAQFDNDQSLATTEFVQRALGSMSSAVIVTSNRVMTAADAGRYLFTNANGVAYTLPNPSGLPLGAVFRITQGNLTSGGSIGVPGGVTIGNITDGGTVTSVSLEQSAEYIFTVVSSTAYQLTVVRGIASGIGSGQTWQLVTRNSGTTYTNTTGKPIMVVYNINGSTSAACGVDVSINGGANIRFVNHLAGTGPSAVAGSIIIPVGATYVFTDFQVSAKNVWELR